MDVHHTCCASFKPPIGFIAKPAKVKVKAIYVGNYAAIDHDARKKARAA